MMDSIKLSEIQILPIKPQNGLIAFASCILNNHIYLGDIAIHTTLDGKGFRLVYPTKTLANGKTFNVFHPITREAGQAISFAITNKYMALIADIEAEKVWKK